MMKTSHGFLVTFLLGTTITTYGRNTTHVISAINQPRVERVERGLQFAQETLNCDSTNDQWREICRIVLGSVNTALKQAGVQISPNEVLFSRMDTQTQRIDTGHSCTNTAELKSSRLSAAISRASRLDFQFDKLSEPLVVVMEVPGQYAAEYNIKERFGIRLFFGSCSNTGSDSYKLSGSVGTTIQAIVAVDLQPKVSKRGPVDFVVSVNPRTVVLFDLSNTDVDLRARGVSPLASVFKFTVALGSTILKAVESLARGKSVERTFTTLAENGLRDIVVPVALNFLQYPNILRTLLLDVFGVYAEREGNKRLNKVESQLEDKINEKIRSSLNVDSRGNRHFTLSLPSDDHVCESPGPKCLIVRDKSEGGNPDLKSLAIAYDENSIQIRIEQYNVPTILPNFVYLYGEHRDNIRLLGRNRFELVRDHGADGHFEDKVCSGGVQIDTTSRSISLELPIDCMPDIAQKRIWVYSMSSRDRLPDNFDARFPENDG